MAPRLLQNLDHCPFCGKKSPVYQLEFTGYIDLQAVVPMEVKPGERVHVMVHGQKLEDGIMHLDYGAIPNIRILCH